MALKHSRLAVCLLNISEARNQWIIEKIANAASNLTISGGHLDAKFKCSSTVLNVFSDQTYNRSVLTIAAPVEIMEFCVTNACKVAYEVIDLTKHQGGHPRLGAVDLVPIYPISSLVTLKQCGQIARGIGQRITTEVPGTSVFFFGAADLPKQRGLVERRKEIGWYKGRYGMSYEGVGFDTGGKPTARYGCTGVGASPYVMNCNVTVETDNVEIGNAIAKKIRGSSVGGLPGVQAMAFQHEGYIEIACNVESYIEEEPNKQVINEQTAYCYTTSQEIKDRVRDLASEYGIGVKGTVIVGFTPDEVYQMAYGALSQGITMAWKTSKLHRM